MLKTGIEALRAIQLASAASEVTYKPLGGRAFAVKAVAGRTVFRSADVDGIWTRMETRDFIVPKELLPLEPQVGDEIEFLGYTYEVLAPSGEPAWRWSDAYHTAYRIHTKDIGGQ
ncbi:MAG: hypothetical protein IJI54_05630 [Kiritimatiellae bacterium]|nr:hypothetical protein [Kiritimatiellia bacterium]